MKIRTHFVLILSLLFSAALVQAAEPDLAALQDAEILNFRAPDTRVMSSGQPTQEQLQVMAEAGVKHVINLRTAGEEVDFDEKAAVEALGMQYHSIPVAGAGGINGDNAMLLSQVLASSGDEPVLVHCATGNRVGGLMAMRHYQSNGNLDAAMAEGERWGMTSERLQGVVRESLEDN